MNIDATGKILGRLASRVAEEASDAEVTVLNTEDAVISGDEEDVQEEYRQKYERGARDRGPYFPRSPDRIVHKTISGMLADDAESNLKTLIGNPDNVETAEVSVKTGDDTKNREYVRIGDISRSLGWER